MKPELFARYQQVSSSHSRLCTPNPLTSSLLQLRYAGNVLWGVCFGFTKASMLFFYLRFATERYFRITCYIAIAVLTLSATSITLVNAFSCIPISSAWDFSKPAHCIDRLSFYLWSMIYQITTDILLMVLPIPILVGLQQGWRVKLGLVAMFSMGFMLVLPACQSACPYSPQC